MHQAKCNVQMHSLGVKFTHIRCFLRQPCHRTKLPAARSSEVLGGGCGVRSRRGLELAWDPGGDDPRGLVSISNRRKSLDLKCDNQVWDVEYVDGFMMGCCPKSCLDMWSRMGGIPMSEYSAKTRWELGATPIVLIRYLVSNPMFRLPSRAEHAWSLLRCF